MITGILSSSLINVINVMTDDKIAYCEEIYLFMARITSSHHD